MMFRYIAAEIISMCASLLSSLATLSDFLRSGTLRKAAIAWVSAVDPSAGVEGDTQASLDAAAAEVAEDEASVRPILDIGVIQTVTCGVVVSFVVYTAVVLP